MNATEFDKHQLDGYLQALVVTGYAKSMEYPTGLGSTISIYQNPDEGKVLILTVLADGGWVAFYPGIFCIKGILKRRECGPVEEVERASN